MHKLRRATIYRKEKSETISLDVELKNRKEIESFRTGLKKDLQADHIYFDYDAFDFKNF